MELLAIILGGIVGYLGVKNQQLKRQIQSRNKRIDFLEYKNAVQEHIVSENTKISLN